MSRIDMFEEMAYHDEDRYNDYFEQDEVKFIKRAKHDSPGDAIYQIIEALYCGTQYDLDDLREDFAYLCDKLGVDDHILEEMGREEARILRQDNDPFKFATEFCRTGLRY